MSREIMTLKELADYLQIGSSKLYRLAQQGTVPGTKIGRAWRFRRDVIDLWFLAYTPPRLGGALSAPPAPGSSEQPQHYSTPEPEHEH